MRSPRKRARSAVASLILLTSLVLAPTSAAADSFIALSGRPQAVEANHAESLIFVRTTDPTQLLILDTQGNELQALASDYIPGFHTSGDKLFVGVTDGSVDIYDIDGLADPPATKIGSVPGLWAEEMAMAGGRLYSRQACYNQYSDCRLRSFDLNTLGDVRIEKALPYRAKEMLASPVDPDTLFIIEESHISRYDVSQTPPQLEAYASSTQGTLEGAAISHDGSFVVVIDSGTGSILKLDAGTLNQIDSWQASYGELEVSPDDSLVAYSAGGVWVGPVGGPFTSVRSIPPSGLAFSTDSNHLYMGFSSLRQLAVLDHLDQPLLGCEVNMQGPPVNPKRGQPIALQGSLSIDGSPAPAGHTVEIWAEGASVGTATTDASGNFSFTDPSPPLLNQVPYVATRLGDSNSVTCYTQTYVYTEFVGSTLTISLSNPYPPAGSAVTVSGLLTFADGANNSGRTLEIQGTDTSPTQVTTGPGGTYSFVDHPVGGDSIYYWAGFTGDGVHAETGASTPFFTPVRQGTTLTLNSPNNILAQGESTTLTAHLTGGQAGDVVTISAWPRGGTKTAIASAAVNASGNLTITVAPDRLTYYYAAFEGNGLKAGSAAFRAINVKPSLNLTLTGNTGRRDAYLIYAPDSEVLATASMVPAVGGDVRFVRQVRIGKKWEAVRSRTRTASAGIAVWRFSTDLLRPANRYRILVQTRNNYFVADHDSAPTYLRVP